MLWAIIWDIVWSSREFHNIKSKDFELIPEGSFITDDSILCIATAEKLLTKWNYTDKYREYFHKYVGKKPNPSFWWGFSMWAMSKSKAPYNSYWNGAAMRVTPIWFYFDTLKETLAEAKKSSLVTHNHPEWIKWAQATVSAIFLARKWFSKIQIKEFIEKNFSYNLSRKLDEIRKKYKFTESCQETVPEAIIAFLESSSFEDAIRNAISIWWDSDTLACITWWIAEAFYKSIPVQIKEKVLFILKQEKELFHIYEEYLKVIKV